MSEGNEVWSGVQLRNGEDKTKERSTDGITSAESRIWQARTQRRRHSKSRETRNEGARSSAAAIPPCLVKFDAGLAM